MARRRASAFVPVLVTSLRVRFQSFPMALGWERRRRLYGIRYFRLLSPSSVRAPVPVSGLRVLVQEFRWPQWQAVFRSLPLTRGATKLLRRVCRLRSYPVISRRTRFGLCVDVGFVCMCVCCVHTCMNRYYIYMYPDKRLQKKTNYSVQNMLANLLP